MAEWRKHPGFTKRERIALELAERMTYPKRRVSEAFFRRLQREFGDEALVELAATVALENFRSKFNPVFGIEAADSCALPEIKQAVGAATACFHDRALQLW